MAEREGHPGDDFAYWHERDMALDHDHCFLCGMELTAENRSDEHVLPKWLLQDFQLHNLELNLLNGTTIRYRSLTIPCCRECNGFWLSQIENQVATAIRAGVDTVRDLERLVLILWMAKIYYGLLFKELALPLDRARPEEGPIMDAEVFAHLRDLHRVLQAARRRVQFDSLPGSVFIFRAQVPEAPSARFDYRDTLITPFLAIRAGETVVVATLLDWGAMADALNHPKFEAAAALELHPFQFAELAAYGAYTSYKFIPSASRRRSWRRPARSPRQAESGPSSSSESITNQRGPRVRSGYCERPHLKAGVPLAPRAVVLSSPRLSAFNAGCPTTPSSTSSHRSPLGHGNASKWSHSTDSVPGQDEPTCQAASAP